MYVLLLFLQVPQVFSCSSPVTDLAQFDGHVEIETVPPVLVHALHHDKTSILSVAADGRYIYSGSQAHDIYVWDRKSLTIKASLSGHTGSVLTLQTYEPKNWLFSASGEYLLFIYTKVR